MEGFVEIIATVGFPIACCIAMGLFLKYIIDTDRKERDEQRKEHAKEMEEVTKALNNNTMVIQRLYDKLGGEWWLK